MNKEFIAVFQLTKRIIFEVKYYTLLDNSHPYFTTSASKFMRNKRDYEDRAQTQREMLQGFPAAMAFFKKWNPCHLKEMSQEQYTEMRRDLTVLERVHNCIVRELDETTRPYNPGFGFYFLADWTKQKPKKKPKKQNA